MARCRRITGLRRTTPRVYPDLTWYQSFFSISPPHAVHRSGCHATVRLISRCTSHCGQYACLVPPPIGSRLLPRTGPAYTLSIVRASGVTEVRGESPRLQSWKGVRELSASRDYQNYDWRTSGSYHSWLARYQSMNWATPSLGVGRRLVAEQSVRLPAVGVGVGGVPFRGLS
jgi:hypothetical protein